MQHDSNTMANSNTPTGVSIHSGFPNPIVDSYDRQSALALDLNQLLVRNPSSTFLFRIRGHHWTDHGIFDGDIAIIDRALQATAQAIVMVWHDDEFVLSRRARLQPDQHVWGVVTAIIHPS